MGAVFSILGIADVKRKGEKMETKVIRMDPAQIDQETMKKAGAILKQGGLVAFPTETVYGLGGNALDEQEQKRFTARRGDLRIIR